MREMGGKAERWVAKFERDGRLSLREMGGYVGEREMGG